MVREHLGVLAEAVGVQALERLEDRGVERAPALLEHAVVGHLVGEGVLERVLEVGKEPRLVQELRGL